MDRLKRAKEEDGWVIVTAVVVMAFMLLVGLALLKVVDSQSKESRRERVRESSFNVAEGLLYAEAAVLQANWPKGPPCAGNTNGCGYAYQTGVSPVFGPSVTATAGNGLGWTCASSTIAQNPSNQCPDPSLLLGTNGASNGTTGVFNNTDIAGSASNVAWTIQVRDDRGGELPQFTNPTYFKSDCSPNAGGCTIAASPGGVDATNLGCVDANGTAAACTYDYNNNKPNRRMWVRVDVNVRGKVRSLVALLQLERFNLPFTANAVVGNSVSIRNSGGSTPVVDTNGSKIITRCTPAPRSATVTPILATPTTLAVRVSDPGTGPGWQSWINNTTNPQVAIGIGDNYEVADVRNGALGFDPNTNTLIFSTNGQRHPPLLDHPVGTQIEAAPRQGNNGNPCAGWDPGQITPQSSYTSIPGYQSGLTKSQFDSLVASPDVKVWPQGGQACPSKTDPNAWTGYIVITGPADCILNPNNGSGTFDINTNLNPGFIVVQNGTLDIEGNTKYHGVVYMRNEQLSSGTVLTLGGTVRVEGGVAVDGDGGLSLGQNLAVQFFPDAFLKFGAAGVAGLVQNSWRELSSGQ